MIEDKLFTQQEVHDILEKILKEYIKHFVNGNMTFGEFAIIENLVIKIQIGLKEFEE